MSAIRVLSPGFQTTVQDLGRFGYAHFGVSASGAADALALRAGNLLVGNAENAAGIEMTLVGGAFEFEADTVVALTGSDLDAGLPLWTPARNPSRTDGPLRGHALGRARLPVRAGRNRGPQDHGQRLRAPADRAGRARAAGRRRAADRWRRDSPPALASAGSAREQRPNPRARPFYASRRGRRRSGSRANSTQPPIVERRIRPHGPAAARPGHPQPRGTHDHRGRAAGRDAGAARRPAHYSVSWSTRPPAGIPSRPT